MEEKYDIIVSVGGKRVPLEQLKCIRVHTEQHINGIPSASLVLSVPGEALLTLSGNPEVQQCQPGEKLWIEVTGPNINGKAVLFSGVITSNRLELNREKPAFTLSVKHDLVKLDTVIRSQTFLDQTDQQIIEILCPKDTFKVTCDVDLSVLHEQQIQFRCSDWQMLRACLDANGAWLIAEPSGVRIVAPTLAGNADHCFTPKDKPEPHGGVLVEYAQWQFTAIDQPKKLSLAAWNIDEQSLTSMGANPSRTGRDALAPTGGERLNDTDWVMNFSTSPSPKELGRKADSLLQHLQQRRVQGEFEVLGSTSYRLGQTLGLSEFGPSVDGSGLISGLRHTLTPSRWRTRVFIGREQALLVAPLPQITGLHIGVVAPFKENDPKTLYRIRVHLPVLGEDGDSNQLWARFAMPYASKESGLYCYPESEDEVVVGFFENNPGYPVIVGALHNPKNKPAVEPSKKNNLKGWQIRQKGNVLFDTDKKTLMLSTGDKALITLDGNKGVAIEGKQEVIIKSSKIDLTK